MAAANRVRAVAELPSPLEPSDAEELYALVEANRAYLSRWMPWAPSSTLEEVRAFIAMGQRQLADDNGFHVALRRDGRIVGVAGFHSIDWLHRSTSIGYWLAEAEQGRGIVTLAVGELLDHAFGVWELHRVEIRAAVDNARSRAIPERLGFRQEGTLREAERLGDRYVDLVVYSMLAPDWG
jgi:ribosomal-protein-serine acetyltransferase